MAWSVSYREDASQWEQRVRASGSSSWEGSKAPAHVFVHLDFPSLWPPIATSSGMGSCSPKATAAACRRLRGREVKRSNEPQQTMGASSGMASGAPPKAATPNSREGLIAQLAGRVVEQVLLDGRRRHGCNGRAGGGRAQRAAARAGRRQLWRANGGQARSPLDQSSLTSVQAVQRPR